MPDSLPSLFAKSLAGISGKDLAEARLLAIETLRGHPGALAAFELAYAKTERSSLKDSLPEKPKEGPLRERIVRELLGQTHWMEWDGGKITRGRFEDPGKLVDFSELEALSERSRPNLTGWASLRDVHAPSWPHLFSIAKSCRETGDQEERQRGMHLFLQGLDILDLDPVLYAMLGMNPDAMSHWLPALAIACAKKGFLKVPKTRICLVPVDILQMARVEYEELTPETFAIIDEWAMRAFDLDISGDYFVRTGTESWKFDFRNARVRTEKEIRELGEYLLYLQYQSALAAGGFSGGHMTGVSIYGKSTTNEWVVREFIHDAENNPTIYHGLPLHTEYRFFVDFDADDILGVVPYWEPSVMKERFGNQDDAAHPDMIHDFVTYSMHEPKLMERFRKNVGALSAHVRAVLPYMDLIGQWSLDIMQNGEDFWAIDMALARDSALLEFIPQDRLKLVPETCDDWLPVPRNKNAFDT